MTTCLNGKALSWVLKTLRIRSNYTPPLLRSGVTSIFLLSTSLRPFCCYILSQVSLSRSLTIPLLLPLCISESNIQGGKFKISLTFPTNYPFTPPLFKFLTPLYHPNVDDQGSVCLSLLKDGEWKPSTRIAAILEGIMGLLVTPNPDDPLVVSIAETYQNNRYLPKSLSWRPLEGSLVRVVGDPSWRCGDCVWGGGWRLGWEI
jgi:ubiquitin-protein ligase